MKRKDLASLLVIAFISAIISLIASGLIFKASTKQTSQVPVVPTIVTAFPDVYNDPIYTSFLNKKALDPTQQVQIGGSNNNQPFNGQ